MDRKGQKKLIISFVCVLLGIHIASFTAFASESIALTSTALTSATEGERQSYADGTYVGSAICSPDANMSFSEYEVTLRVVVSEGLVTNIMDISAETNAVNSFYLSLASSKLVQQVVAAQGTEGVDTVSGATCSSKAILAAYENALLSVPIDDDSGDDESDDEEYSYADGTFSAYSRCTNGEYINYNVGVQITLEDGIITNISEITYRESLSHVDLEYYEKALVQVPNQILQTNNPSGIDVVTGATLSSFALADAAAQAMEMAKVSAKKAPTVTILEGYQVNYSTESVTIGLGTDDVSQIYYTLDGSDPTTESLLYEGAFSLSSEAAEGEQVIIKAISVVENEISEIGEQKIVFTPDRGTAYADGIYADTDASLYYYTAPLIRVENGLIQSIDIIETDDVSEEEIELCREYLIPAILQTQSFDVENITEAEELSMEIKNCIEKIMYGSMTDDRVKAGLPIISYSKEADYYDNSQEVTLSLSSLDGTTIYYTLDGSDPKRFGVEYTGEIKVRASQFDAEVVRLRAIAMDKSHQASEEAEETFVFQKAYSDTPAAFNGTFYRSFSEAVSALNASVSGGTITIYEDIVLSPLTLTTAMPEKECVIESAEGALYSLKTIENASLAANADLTLKNVRLDMIALYANGHTIHIDSGVATDNVFAVYAGGYDGNVASDAEIDVRSGIFSWIFGSGLPGTILSGGSRIALSDEVKTSAAGVGFGGILQGEGFVIVEDNLEIHHLFGEAYNGQADAVTIELASQSSLTEELNLKASLNRKTGTLITQDGSGIQKDYSTFNDVIIKENGVLYPETTLVLDTLATYLNSRIVLESGESIVTNQLSGNYLGVEIVGEVEENSVVIQFTEDYEMSIPSEQLVFLNNNDYILKLENDSIIVKKVETKMDIDSTEEISISSTEDTGVNNTERESKEYNQSTNEESTGNDDTNAVNTGVNQPLVLMIVLFLISAAGIIIIKLKRH